MAAALLRFLHFHLLLQFIQISLSSSQPCKNKCGSLDVHYPLGTGYGCGSPRFQPYVTCGHNDDNEQLLLTTHTGTYPITTISYTAATLTISPPLMSTCTSMHPSPTTTFGIDWASPFRLGSSAFILLSCAATATVSSPLCDASYTHLCASIHSCPAISSLGLAPFAPTNTCCVYSPANLNAKGDLDLQELKCAAYASVVTLGDRPTDPSQWQYGIELKYVEEAGFDSSIMGASCMACERSDGICGYAPPRNNFVCVCKNGVNSSADCYNNVNGNNQVVPYWDDQSHGCRKAQVFCGGLCVVAVFVMILVSLVNLFV